jgi:hypothetical protein
VNLRHMCATLPLFFSIFLSSVLIGPVYADDLTVSSGKFSYSLGATIDLEGQLAWQSNPVVNGLVAVQVEDIAGNLKFVRVVTAGTAPSPWKVRVVSLQSCDYQGNAKNSFNRGELAFFNLTVRSLDSVLERQVTLALNIFDSVGVSLAVTKGKFSLAPGRMLPFFASISIPDDAYLGTAICCASVMSELPANDGYPYCSEQSIGFTITGTGTQFTGKSAASATGSGGTYHLTFKLPNSARIGSYYVYTTAYHDTLGQSVFARARNGLFDYYWLLTDVNRDGVVNVLDVSMTAKAFGTRAGDPGYNRFADAVSDNVINILDISAVAKDYGRRLTSWT